MAKKFGMGFMRLPLIDADVANIDLDQVCKMVDKFMERGFTYFDTAFPYHNRMSEPAVRKAVVERYPRDSFTIADKMPIGRVTSDAMMEEIFAGQLKDCGVEYFDYYLLHNIVGSAYENAEKRHAFDFLQRIKAEGKARNIGISYHDTAERLDKILTEHPELDFVQLQINYIDWANDAIQSGKCYEVAVKHGKPVVVMEPVKGGTLATVPDEAEALMKAVNPDMSIPSWAIRFAASLDNVMVVLSGMGSLEQAEDNTGYMQDFKPLNDEEKAVIAKVTDIIRSSVAIGCTGCGYCVEYKCPKNIPIPDYFALYNADKQDTKSGWKSQQAYYRALKERFGAPQDCLKCGKCEGVCPQHLKIRDLLVEVGDYFG